MGSRRATLVPVSLCALAALPLAGCGSDPSYAHATGGKVHLHLDEYRVAPEHVQVQAGRITIYARNTGRLTHNLEVVAFARPRSGEQERVFGRKTRTLFPGQTGSTTLTLRPGKYRLLCTIANHDNLGQYGELKVVG
ncbi:MAG: plastocyanin/azurin family copper-binding protein [Solirubrobacteraceae bacterium]